MLTNPRINWTEATKTYFYTYYFDFKFNFIDLHFINPDVWELMYGCASEVLKSLS